MKWLSIMEGRYKITIVLCLAFLLGSSVTLALAPYNFWPLGIIAPLGLHQLLSRCTSKQSLLIAWSFGAGVYVIGTHWLYVSIHVHGHASPPLAAFLTVGFNLFMGSMFMPFFYVYHKYLKNLPTGNTLAFAGLWVSCEFFRGWILTGFPWMLIGYSQIDQILSGWAPIISVFGISGILAYSAAVISKQITYTKPLKQWAFVLILWLAPLLLDSIEWTKNKSETPLSISLIQANIPQEDKWNPVYKYPIMQLYLDLSMAHKDSDLIIWPETAIPSTYHKAMDFLDDANDFANKNNIALITGIPSTWYRDDQLIYHNSVITLGKADGIYHKHKLVPFGEYVPLESLLRGVIAFFDLPMSSFRPGPKDQEPLEVFSYKIMPYLCYEIIFPELVAKSASQADILLTISNDTWFGSSIGPIQHMQMARMRALETGRYVIRGTNNGITAIIDPSGNVTDRLPQFEQGVLTGKAFPRQGLTPVSALGTSPILIFAIFFALLPLVLGKIRKSENA